MKSPIHRGNRIGHTQPVTVINDAKYISKISEQKIPKKYYTTDDNLEQENSNNFLTLYGIICVYIFLIMALIIGGGGIAVCIVYFNSAENTQNWKIGGIILGAVTCIITIILMILTIYKQTHNRPWRYQVKEIFLHPENYFTDDMDQLSTDGLLDDDDDDDDDESQDNISNHTVDATISNPSMGLLKTVHNNLVYCLGCNRLHSSTEECIKPKRTPHTLPPLDRSKSSHSRQDSNKEKSLKKNKSKPTIDRSVKYSLSNENQIDVSGNTADNLVLKRVPIPTTKVITKQQQQQSPTTKIMIVRVPKVPGELVIQPKEH